MIWISYECRNTTSNRSQIIEEAKFTYSTLGKAWEKQTEKRVDTIKSINISNKVDELKTNEEDISIRSTEWSDSQ